MTKTTRRYRYGGALIVGQDYYIPRKADDELLKWCLEGEYAYIFNASQTGKSSLLERTRHQLLQRGIHAVSIDLQGLGTAADADEWYRNVADMLGEKLKLGTDVKGWWVAHSSQMPTRRWVTFFEQVVLTEIEERVVIFIDEVDRTRPLPFRADIYGALRALHTGRTTEPKLRRLSFVLAGLAAPHELIGDLTQTAHNIWKGVSLGDLTEKDGAIDELAEGLGLWTPEKRNEALGWILGWTGGHPYLTQKMCARVQDQEWKDCEAHNVDQLVTEEFLSGENEDNNLSYLERELTKERSEGVTRMAVLAEYERVLRDGRVSDTNTAAQVGLKETGVVKVADGWLRVRNRIYQEVFDKTWLRRHFRTSIWGWLQLQPRNVQLSLQLLSIMFFMLVFAVYVAVDRQQQSVQFAATAVAERERAVIAATQANAERDRADQAARLAHIRELAAESQASEDVPNRQMLLAIESAMMSLNGEPRLPEAEQALRDAFPMMSTFRLESNISAIALSPDGRWLATTSPDDVARVWDMNDMSIEPLVVRGYEGVIENLAISPDGRWLAVIFADNTGRLWDMQDLRAKPVMLNEFEDRVNPGDFISSLDFSPDGRWLAERDIETTRVWDMNNLRAAPVVLRGQFEGTTDAPVFIFTPDSHWLVTASGDNLVQLWDMNNLSAEPIVLRGDEDRFWTNFIDALAISPDGRWLVTGSDDARVRVWDMNNLSVEPVVLLSHEETIYTTYSLAFSPDGRWLAAGSDDNTARVWDMDNLGAAPVALRGHGGWIFRLAFSPDGRWLATGSDDNTARVWDMNDLNTEPIILRGHDDGIWWLAFSPDGHWLTTVSVDSARAWDMTGLSIEPIILRGPRGHDDGILALAFSPDGHWLATGTYDNARVWNIKDLSAVPTLLLGRVDDVAFSPDGRWLATGGEDNTVRIWDITDLSAQPVVLRGINQSLAFSPNGRWLATEGEDNTVQLWDMNKLSAAPIVLHGHKDRITRLAFSPDGHWVATGSSDADTTVRIWDMNKLTAEPIVLPDHEGSIWALAFSPDSHWLATGAGGGDPTSDTDFPVRVWDMDNLSTTPIILGGYEDGASELSFSPDGHWLATGSISTVEVWDMDNLSAPPVVPRGFEGSVSSLAFSPDGHWLTISSYDYDGITRVWDMANISAEPVILQGTKDRSTFAFGQDGRWLATGGYDGTVWVWNMDLEQLIKRACQITGRNFTQAEWIRYFPDEAYRKTCQQWPAGQ